MNLQWEILLCPETLKEKEKTPSSWVDYPLDPFEQDYREIVSSVSFRHLQDKTQIYPLGKGDFVRTRLTHSLEVSTIAKQLGIMMVFNKKWSNIPVFSGLNIEYARSIPTVLASAGLLHDMGNPPFGHIAEHSISHWFKTNLSSDDFTFCGTPVRCILNDQMLSDLCNFEGNAQVIRMLSKCRFPSDEHEANVTLAVISTLLKYPASTLEINRSLNDIRVHKSGYYYSEKELVARIREKTGLVIPGQPHARNPLTYLLEAADDIAYVASDIEDVISKSTISISQLVSYLQKRVLELPQEGNEMHQLQLLTAEGIVNNLKMRLDRCGGTSDDETEALHSWTNYLKNWLMYVTASSFVSNWEAIMNGTFENELLAESHHKFTVRLIKDLMYTIVYPHLSNLNLSAFNILYYLVERFAKAVVYWDTSVQLDELNQMYIDCIPERFKRSYFFEKNSDESENLYLRFRMVLDYISSMTDGYALDLYKRFNAISY